MSRRACVVTRKHRADLISGTAFHDSDDGGASRTAGRAVFLVLMWNLSMVKSASSRGSRKHFHWIE